ncbi:hypothetical protein [Streptomyces erythrochromogenes]|uniref:hypothetical protein n=1 Tax=Streptomyces erythrochromogenes TaxID=285574 RepID=UPI0038027106
MRDQTDRGHGSVGGPVEAGAVVFVCAACGVPLTGPLSPLPAVPEAPYHAWSEDDEPGPLPVTVPSGRDAIETEPYGAPLVVADVPGPDGGMNQLCACGTLVATPSSDCAAPYELHLSAAHVRAVRP